MTDSFGFFVQSILSRPPAYRELELDQYGNVVSIAKVDPDKFPPRRYHLISHSLFG